MKSFILMVIAMVCVVSLEAQNKSFYPKIRNYHPIHD